LLQNLQQMKKILLGLIVILGVSATAVNAQGVAPTTTATTAPAKMAMISFVDKENKFEFGSVPQGTPVTHVFNFKNTGKEPLILSAVNTTCGCTVPEWPKEPILPGAAAAIKVTYNAANAGDFTKVITVVSNAATPTASLTIHGDVKPVATQAAQSTAAPAQVAAPKKN
jgi:hypothetical protein